MRKRDPLNIILNILIWACICLSVAIVMAKTYDVYAAEVNKPRKVIKVGYPSDEVFYVGSSDGDYKKGYTYEYYRDLADIAGWDLEYVYGTQASCYEALKNGAIDILGNITKGTSDDKYFLLSEVQEGEERYYLFVSDNSDIEDYDINSLSGKRIGAVFPGIGYNMLCDFKTEKNLDITIVKASGLNALDLMVKAEDIDGFVYTDMMNIEGYRATFQLGAVDFYFGVNRFKEELLNELNRAQAILLERNPYYAEKLREEYSDKNVVNAKLTTEEKAWLSNHSVIRVGYRTDSMPYTISYSEGMNGFLFDMAELFEKRLGIPFELIAYGDVRELKSDLKEGKIDLIYPVVADKWMSEKNGLISSISPITDKMVFLYNRDYKGSVTDYSKVGYLKTSTSQELYLLKHSLYKEAKSYSSLDQLFNALARDEIDCIYIDSIVANYRLMLNNNSDNIKTMKLDDEVSFSFGADLSNHTIISILNKAINYYPSSVYTDSINLNSQPPRSYTRKQFFHEYQFLINSGIILLAAVLGTLVILAVKQNKKLRKALKIADSARIEANKARITAEEADRHKTDFLSSMSHDIRTPVNALAGLMELTLKHTNEPEVVEGNLRKMQTSNRHLVSMINDVLDISAIETGKLRLKPVEYNIQSGVDRLYSIFEPQMNIKNIKGDMNVHDIIRPWVLADEVRISQIFTNILSNAVKYTHEGGLITFEMFQRVNDYGNLETIGIIKDTGVGMSKELMENMWDLFTRGTDTRINSIQGAGLGLPIVKHLIDLMGGTVEVESEENKGTTFKVILPLEPVEHTDPKETAEEEIEQLGIHILIAEDNEMNWEIENELMEMHGISCDHAEDGQICFDMFTKADPGTYKLILMDMQMPNVDGVTSTKMIRASEHPEAKTIPILALTANTFDEDVKACLDAGMNEHLSKPIDMAKVLEAFKKYI